MTEYKLESFKGKLYTNDNYKEMNNSDIIHCYNRFLIKCCENEMSLFYFAEKLDNLYPDRFGLYYENKIFEFFKLFIYSDYELTENEKKYLISVNEDTKLWDGPIIEDNHFLSMNQFPKIKIKI